MKAYLRTYALWMVAVFVLAPVLCLHLLFRAWQAKSTVVLQRFGQRWGRYTAASWHGAESAVIWLHAVSVGETKAAQPLIAALLAQGYRIVLSQTTATGYLAAQKLYAQALHDKTLHLVWFAWDFPWAIKNLLRVFAVQKAVWLECEAWPFATRACVQAKVPVFLVNARLSQKSLQRGLRQDKLFGGLLRHTLSHITLCCQDEQDAQRLACLMSGDEHAQQNTEKVQHTSFALPNNIHVCGNLKFDFAQEAHEQKLWQQGLDLRQAISLCPALVLASSREGEEGLLLQAWQTLVWQGFRCDKGLPSVDTNRAIPNSLPLLIIVPRHPERFDEVAKVLVAYGLAGFSPNAPTPLVASYLRRSQFSSFTDMLPVLQQGTVRVLLWDSMGELSAAYALCSIALMGGTLLPYGGQNLIEPCALGRAVLLGPSTFNFAAAAQTALACGAALPCRDAAHAVQQFLALTAQTGIPQLNAMQHDAQVFAQQYRGATQRVLQKIDEV